MSNFITLAEAQAFEKQMLEISGHKKVEDAFNSIFKQDGQTVNNTEIQKHIITKEFFTKNAKAVDDMLARQVKLMKDKVATAERNDSIIKALTEWEFQNNCNITPEKLIQLLNAGAKANYENFMVRQLG